MSSKPTLSSLKDFPWPFTGSVWWNHRAPTPPSSTCSEDKNHLNEEIAPLLPTGIGERFSQTISNLGHAALLSRCDSPYKRKYWTTTRGALYLIQYSEGETCLGPGKCWNRKINQEETETKIKPTWGQVGRVGRQCRRQWRSGGSWSPGSRRGTPPPRRRGPPLGAQSAPGSAPQNDWEKNMEDLKYMFYLKLEAI